MTIRAWAWLPLFLLFSCGSKEEPQSTAKAPSVCSAQGSVAAAGVNGSAPETAGKRFLVKLKDGPAQRANALGAQARLQMLGTAKPIATGLYLVSRASPASAAEVLRAAGEGVEYVEPDYEVRAALASNDPDIGEQWAHSVVQSEKAWEVGRGGAGVTVAIVDSGSDPTHEDLAANMWTNPGEVAGNGLDDDGDGYADDVHGWNFVADTPDVTADDSSMHGTHVSGTIGAVGNNGVGISGHAPLVRLMPLKFLSSTGSGSTSDAIRAIDYAIAHGARIISNSWGSFGRSQSLEDAIGRAKAAGILFVAAAGNNGTNNSKLAFYPANSKHDNVISVAASTRTDHLASFSDYGNLVHLAAPGYKIYSTKNGNKYQTLSGTSMATPLVSGVLATMIAARPDLSYKQIKGALLASVDSVPALTEKVLWNGRINAYEAMRLVTSIPAGWEPPEPPAHACP